MTTTTAPASTSDLGKTIAAMASDGQTIKELSKGRTDLYQLNPFNIQVEEGFNTRGFESERAQEKLESLAESIATVGVKRPLLVRMVNNVPVLVDGERRLRATMIAIDKFGAEIRSVPVQLAARGMTSAQATLQIAIQNDGEPLNALERAMVFERLRNYGWSDKEIGSSVGLTPLRVSQLIDLVNLPPQVQGMIRNEEISATLASDIARQNNFDEEATLKAVQAAQDKAQATGRKRVTARSVEGRVSFKKEVVSAFSDATVEVVEQDEGSDLDEVMIVMSRAEFDRIAPLMKLSLPNAE